MRILFSVILIAVVFTACTKQKVIDTGTANPIYNGSMLEFMRRDSFNWDLTVKLIERAGLQDLFEGKVDSMKKFTFLGFKSISVQRYLFDSQYKDSSAGKFFSVSDIPIALARTLVLRHVIKDRFLKDDIAFRDKQYQISDPKQMGGTKFTTLAGNRVWLYKEGSDYGGVADAGPVILKVYSITRSRIIPMATPDIQPTNGVIHALNYGYEFPII